MQPGDWACGPAGVRWNIHWLLEEGDEHMRPPNNNPLLLSPHHVIRSFGGGGGGWMQPSSFPMQEGGINGPLLLLLRVRTVRTKRLLLAELLDFCVVFDSSEAHTHTCCTQ